MLLTRSTVLDRPPGRVTVAPVAGLLLASAVLVVSAVAVAPGPEPLPGLPSAGRATDLLLPVARVLHHVTAAGTVGVLLLRGVLLPRRDDVPTAVVGRVRPWAAGWALSAVASAVLWLSDALAVPVGELPEDGGTVRLALATPTTQALLSTAWVAVVIVVAGREAAGLPVVRALLLAALLGALPTVVVGHAGAHGGPVAVVSVAAHVWAVTVWVGGLLAVVVYLRGRPGDLAVAVPRLSRLALVCVSTVVASGGVSALAVTDLDPEPGYVRLLLLKVVLLLALVAAGARHRRATVPALAAGRPAALLRLAAGELVVMGAALGLAVLLASSTP